MKVLKIGFIGFEEARLHALKTLATQAGFCYSINLSPQLHLLCEGLHANADEILKAQESGLVIIDESQFLTLAAKGVLPQDIATRLTQYSQHKIDHHHYPKANKQHGLKCIRHAVIDLAESNQVTNYNHLLLDIWLKTEPSYLADDLSIALVDLVEDIVTAKAISQDEIDELFELIDDQIEAPSKQGQDVNTYKDLYTGIKKLPLDIQLNAFHKETIEYWLSEYQDCLKQWPGTVLAKALIKVQAHAKLDSESKRQLMELVTSIGSIHPYHTEFHPSQTFTQGCIIKHTNHTFCFAGRFDNGERSQFEEKVKQLGGYTDKHLSDATHYLVIGNQSELHSPYSNPSRKLTKAKQMQAAGRPIAIVSERQWLNSVKQTYVNYGT